MICAIDVMA